MADLIDFRGKLTPLTNQVLEARKLATGKEHQEQVREVMHIWALQQIEEANLIVRLTRREGVKGETYGGAVDNLPRASVGNRTDD